MIEFEILDVLCNKYMGLSPLEVLNADLSDVLELYVNCIIHDTKEKKKNNKEGDVWVTSQNANWH